MEEWLKQGKTISIPAPARGATNTTMLNGFAGVFQFPPLREGRLVRELIRKNKVIISIPAPARGATGPDDGGTARHPYFNSRPCERGDQMPPNSAVALFISIPAPARGATRGALRCAEEHLHFNSRPCERGDSTAVSPSTPCGNFNSRPCERGDAVCASGRENHHISIPAPARGATWHQGRLHWGKQISIPAPARGATSCVRARYRANAYFNSRPCERGDVFRLAGKTPR